MAGDYKTSEARAFREHYDKLVDSIQEPDLPVLGARFFSRHIIRVKRNHGASGKSGQFESKRC